MRPRRRRADLRGLAWFAEKERRSLEKPKRVIWDFPIWGEWIIIEIREWSGSRNARRLNLKIAFMIGCCSTPVESLEGRARASTSDIGGRCCDLLVLLVAVFPRRSLYLETTSVPQSHPFPQSHSFPAPGVHSFHDTLLFSKH